MKKGLILALLMVAMVSLVIPAGAKAPIVYSLPDVIVGDNNNAEGTGFTPTNGDYVVLRFIDAFDLANSRIINWNNDDSYTTDLKKVFWTVSADPETTLGVFTEAGYVDAITAGEWTALTGGTPPADPALNVIQQVTGDWKTAVSFVDLEVSPMAEADLFVADTAVTSLTSGVYVYSGTADYSKVVTVKMAAVMTSGTKVVGNFTGTGNQSWDEFTVTCTKTAADSAKTKDVVIDHDLTGATDKANWTFVNTGMPSYVSLPTSVSDATGIGFNIGTVAADKTGHARWDSAFDTVPGDEAVVYCMTATLASTAATSDDCPGFRLYFKNRASTHVGGVYFRHKSNAIQFGGEELAPFTSNNKQVKLLWAVPATMTEHADGEVLSKVDFDGGWNGTNDTDARSYQVTFELIGDAGDAGRITMPAVLVESFASPAFGTLMKAPDGKNLAWGTPAVDTTLPTGRSFLDGTGAWKADTFGAALAWTQANPTITASAMTLACAADGTAGSYSRATQGGIASATTPQNVLVPEAGHTYRLTFEAKSGNVKTTPWYRCVISQNFPWDATVGAYGAGGTKQMFWEEFWAYGQYTHSWYQGVWDFTSLIPLTAIPTSPTAAGTKCEVYINAHDVAAPTGSDYSTTTQVVLEFSALCDGAFGAAAPGFGSNGSVIINYVAWDDLGTDY